MTVTITELASWTLRSSLVLALTLGCVRLLPRGCADRRHTLLVTGLLLGVLLPVLCSPFPGLELAVLPATVPAASHAGPGTRGEAVSILATAALALWISGAVILAGGLTWAHLQVRRWTRLSETLLDPRWQGNLKVLSADLEMRAPAELRIAAGISGPLTCGLFRPVILVPETARRWTVTELRATLAHELGHVARRDCASRCITQIVCALQWFNPLVWILRHRLLAEQEEACDRLALRSGLRPSQYAAALVAIRRALESNPASRTPLAASPLGETDALAERLTDLLRGGAPPVTTPAIVLVCALMILALPLATLRLTRHASAPQSATGTVTMASDRRTTPAVPQPTLPPGTRQPSTSPSVPEARPEPLPRSGIEARPASPASREILPALTSPAARRAPAVPRRTGPRRLRFTLFGCVRVVVGWPR